MCGQWRLVSDDIRLEGHDDGRRSNGDHPSILHDVRRGFVQHLGPRLCVGLRTRLVQEGGQLWRCRSGRVVQTVWADQVIEGDRRIGAAPPTA